MSMNDTPSGERVHISFFGKRNAGKSLLVNKVTNQDLSVVSDTKGTTTDPVMKAMELLPLGPVVIIDTPGFDDEGELGELRVKKTRQILNKTDIAVLVTDGTKILDKSEKELIELFRRKKLPYLLVKNKSDLFDEKKCDIEAGNTNVNGSDDENTILVSALTGENIEGLKERLARIKKDDEDGHPLISDLIDKNAFAVLVIPIDESAPKGRIILPQQQVIRELLDIGASATCVKETELKGLLEKMKPLKPDVVITDSQAFGQVSKDVPRDVPLTSFSILMARHKGFLDAALKGVKKIDELMDGDVVLIAEGCTHHRQCNDIGTVKIPRWLKDYTKKNIKIESCQGRDFPEDLTKYALIIHCGGCMLNEREVKYRMNAAIDNGVPFTNYGTVIAHMKGILERSIEIVGNKNE
ncbi:MAG: [FeFe] hydrogenase H-cluster maturation GTPase HydF [Lachnospiraceae bacterium]|nr:[FeFe] hydrogenase H-cluster maturation GTPase HydF [Lachnospiraceae bacterium]